MYHGNVVLIGMPGVGKSTVGVVAAKRLGFDFVDCDLVLQKKTGRKLHELIGEFGIEQFWKLEEETNMSITGSHLVIATGGSACYEEQAMQYFKNMAKIVYLKISYGELVERLGDLTARGVTLRPGQTLKDLYEERIPLYTAYADHVLECDGKSLRDLAIEICRLVENDET